IASTRVVEQIQETALNTGWELDGSPLVRMGNLLAFRRPADFPRKRVYLSSGMHGDEPAGPLAVLELLRDNPWPKDLELWLCPCLNPSGFSLNRRENEAGIDLNRDYRRIQTAEIRAHISWLQEKPLF